MPHPNPPRIRRALFPALLALLASASPVPAGQLVLTPSNLDFGEVDVVAPPVARTVRIVNHGSPTTIFGFDPAAGCGAFTASAPGLPKTLGDLDTLVAQVFYDPIGRGPAACAFKIHDDNGVSDVLGMTGVGISTALSVSDTLLPFAVQPFATAVPETLWVGLSNDGNETIQAPHLTMHLESGTDFQAGPPTLPIARNGGQSLLPVIFHPASAGAKYDWLTLSLDNDLPSDPDEVIHLQGAWTDASTSVSGPTPVAAIRCLPVPAYGSVRVTFDAPRAGRASIEICDLAGRAIARREQLAAGAGAVIVTLERGADWSPAPGVYLARVIFEGRVLGSQRLVVLR